MHVSAIIAAGGRGVRFGASQPKQLLPLGGRPILQRSVDAFVDCDLVDEVIVALPADLVADVPAYLRGRTKPVRVVAGGERRQDSVARALAAVAAATDVVLVHDAARPFVSPDLIRRMVDAAREHGAAIAAIQATDTVKRADPSRSVAETIPRESVFLAQTPQAFRLEVLRSAYDRVDAASNATDEAALVERAGYRVHLVDGDPRNVKITTTEDLAMAERWLGTTDARPHAGLRIGNGYDLHRLVPDRPLRLGGVTIPFEKGLLGHSDADVVCHAVTDAILGAASAGDIGRLFPDTDPAWKGADSLDLLSRAAAVVESAGYAVTNVDVVVIAQRPKLVPHLAGMRENLARALGIAVSDVSIKGKTNEGVDSMGAGESIAAHAVALVTRR